MGTMLSFHRCVSLLPTVIVLLHLLTVSTAAPGAGLSRNKKTTAASLPPPSRPTEPPLPLPISPLPTLQLPLSSSPDNLIEFFDSLIPPPVVGICSGPQLPSSLTAEQDCMTAAFQIDANMDSRGARQFRNSQRPAAPGSAPDPVGTYDLPRRFQYKSCVIVIQLVNDPNTQGQQIATTAPGVASLYDLQGAAQSITLGCIQEQRQPQGTVVFPILGLQITVQAFQLVQTSQGDTYEAYQR